MMGFLMSENNPESKIFRRGFNYEVLPAEPSSLLSSIFKKKGKKKKKKKSMLY